MIKIKEYISHKISDYLSTLDLTDFIDAESIKLMLEYPPDSEMGDVSFPCFKLSKLLKKSPMMIAGDISEKFDDTDNVFGNIECKGGYLNFKISTDYLLNTAFDSIVKAGKDYGKSDIGNGKTVVLDYSSPNVAKPFHIGHLGTTVIGHSLKMIYQFLGYNCIGINHLGDWGTQFGKLIVAYRTWGDKQKIIDNGIDELVSLYVKFHKEAEINENLNNQARAEFTKLEQNDPENIELWKWFIDISLKEYNKTYDQLGITFDSYNGESFYTDKMPEQVKKLQASGLLKIDDGASIVDLSEYGMPPCLILKKDGSTLYPTRDIAAAVYRKRNYDFDKCIYVTSAGQCLHFAQWFKVVELMGYDWYDKLVHVPYGTVSINGEKLATRTGNVILLKDLFSSAIEKALEIIEQKNPNLENKDNVAQAVGVGAIVFYYLSNNRIKDINFVMEDALSFEGNTGPYAQYTYARCCSIINNVGMVNKTDFSHIKITDDEIALIKTLMLFGEKVFDAAKDYEPMIITRYIIDICSGFNRFYQNCPIMSENDDAIKYFRISLVNAVKNTLENSFKLICLKAVPKI